MKRMSSWSIVTILCCALAFFPAELMSQGQGKKKDLDETVKSFLAKRRGTWRDLNIPASDGEILYTLITKNHYKKTLEIGTSTGHSGIFIAWALSKTGGRMTTIEIDKGRYREALANFKEAGLSDYVEARLGDAHMVVKELKGPFDFIFCDADKEWYKNYFIELYPKLVTGGCYTAHNPFLVQLHVDKKPVDSYSDHAAATDVRK